MNSFQGSRHILRRFKLTHYPAPDEQNPKTGSDPGPQTEEQEQEDTP